MAWVHSNWITETTVADRESKLRLHIVEVTDAITAKMQSDGTAVDPTTVQQYLEKTLQPELAKISGGGSRITRGRVINL